MNKMEKVISKIGFMKQDCTTCVHGRNRKRCRVTKEDISNGVIPYCKHYA